MSTSENAVDTAFNVLSKAIDLDGALSFLDVKAGLAAAEARLPECDTFRGVGRRCTECHTHVNAHRSAR